MVKDFYSMITMVLESKLVGERWDPDYWNPDFIRNVDLITSLPSKNANFTTVKKLADYEPFITYGVIATGRKRLFSKTGVKYISATTVQSFGLIHAKLPLYIPVKDKRNKADRKPHYGDILFNRSGEGTIGRNAVFLYETNDYVISDDVDIIKISNISPFWVSLFLSSKFGNKQIQRFIIGVSGQTKISFDKIKSILIPEPKMELQIQIKTQYLRMHSYLETLLSRNVGITIIEKTIGELFCQLVQQVEDLIENKRTHIQPLEILNETKR
jgi:restriction endonuclease S subunit